MPGEALGVRLDVQSVNDPELNVWLNKLLDLCQKLGSCEEEDEEYLNETVL